MVTNTYRVLVDWDNDGNFLGTYDDIVDDCLSIQVRRGRDYASQLTGNSTAGTLRATLKNADGKYSPNNVSSPIYGKIRPACRVAFALNSGSFPYSFPITFDETPMWTGRLINIRPSPASTQLNTAEFEAEGPLGYINDFTPDTQMKTNIRTSDAVEEILDKAGWSATERDIKSGLTTMTRWWADSNKTIDALRIVEETENGFIKETYDGKIGFESRNTRLFAPYDTSQATFSDASDATYTYMSLAQDDPLANVLNNVQALVRKYNVQAGADVWDVGEDYIQLEPFQSISLIATFPNSSSDTRAVTVDEWTIPEQGVDFIANTQSDGEGDNMSEFISISDLTRTVTQMGFTLKNESSTTTVYLTTVKARGDAVFRTDTTIMQAIDSDSQSIYGERKFTADTPFMPSMWEAQSWCNYQIQVYSSPVDVLTMNFSANISEENNDEMINRDISDRITVIGSGESALGIGADFFIEEIRHTITEGGQLHMVQWKLSPAQGGYSQFWKLGTGVLATSTCPSF